MSTEPLFYKKVTVLNKNQHGKLYIEPVKNYNHTRDTNSVYVAAIEFPRASREYPIVFGKAGEDVFPVVLIGLESNSNRYLGKKGEWLADYIPAYVRRYPFILASNDKEEGNFAVCIDESYPGFNTSKKGEPLFDDKGEESGLLKQNVEFLKDYQNNIQLTRLFCNNINKLGLLEPMQVNVEKDGKKQALGGFLCVNRNKIKTLADSDLLNLVKTDQMELIYAHLGSLNNLNRLLKTQA